MVNEPINPLGYYARHGLMTEPGTAAGQLTSLSQSITVLCEVIQGLVIHYRSGELYGVELPAERLDEVRTRHVARILDRILALDGRPLIIPRPPQRRFIGCCRDFAVLLCAVLRSQGVPARVRCGFSTYFDPGFCFDHWIAEYWHSDEQRWVRVDAEMDALKRAHNRLTFDPADIPAGKFLVAGQVWQACRNGALDPSRFGYDPSASGLWAIRNCLLHDLACLNKVELTPWDAWGVSDKPFEDLTETETLLLDRAAALTAGSRETFDTMRSLYLNEISLRVPAQITSYTLDDQKTRVQIGSLASA